MTNAPSSKKSYFDLHINGVGYLNRVRTVTPKRGSPFLACDIKALNGPSDAVEYCGFDVKVSGKDAQSLIRRCELAVKANRKVLIGFRLGDLWVDQFTYSSGDKAGQPGVSLKARLLFVSFIKIDGQMEYKAESKETEQTAAAATSESSSNSEAAVSETADADAESLELAESV